MERVIVNPSIYWFILSKYIQEYTMLHNLYEMRLYDLALKQERKCHRIKEIVMRFYENFLKKKESDF